MISKQKRSTRNTMCFVVAAATLLVYLGYNRNASPMLPREVEGVWRTDDPRYQDRSLELSPAFVIVVPGLQEQPSVQFINKVEAQINGTDSAFTVHSTDFTEDTHEVMTFSYRPVNGGEIRFGNQAQVWTRRSPASN